MEEEEKKEGKTNRCSLIPSYLLLSGVSKS